MDPPASTAQTSSTCLSWASAEKIPHSPDATRLAVQQKIVQTLAPFLIVVEPNVFFSYAWYVGTRGHPLCCFNCYPRTLVGVPSHPLCLGVSSRVGTVSYLCQFVLTTVRYMMAHRILQVLLSGGRLHPMPSRDRVRNASRVVSRIRKASGGPRCTGTAERHCLDAHVQTRPRLRRSRQP